MYHSSERAKKRLTGRKKHKKDFERSLENKKAKEQEKNKQGEKKKIEICIIK
jgi:hypothetical protein